MRAFVYKKEKCFELAERKKPQVKNDNDVLLRVPYCGICGTDIGIFQGHHPANKSIVLGHEYCGVVEDAGDGVTHLKKGDKVVVDPNLKCGVCFYCRNGLSSQCKWMATGTTLGIFNDGGLAPYNVAPAGALYKIPDDMNMRDAAIVEPLSCVLNGVKTAGIQPEDTVLIIGAGPIGTLFIDVVARIASRVVVSEKDAWRRSHSEFYTKHVFDPSDGKLKEKVRELTNGLGCDVVIEATGYCFEDALACVKKRGKVVLFGMNQNVQVNFKPYDITRNEIRVFGSYIQDSTFDPAIQMLHHGRVNLNHYVTHELPLEKIGDAFLALGLDLSTGKPVKAEAIKILVKLS